MEDSIKESGESNEKKQAYGVSEKYTTARRGESEEKRQISRNAK